MAVLFVHRAKTGMQKLLLFVDQVSTFVGQAFSWLIVVLTLLISWEVFSRYVLDNPHAWAFDVDDHAVRHAVHDGRRLHAVARTATCAATCSTASSSRARRPAIDLTLYILFFIPGVSRSPTRATTTPPSRWAINEHSNVTADGPPVYPFKTIIPIAGAHPAAAGHRRDRALRHLPASRASGPRARRTWRRSTSTS